MTVVAACWGTAAEAAIRAYPLDDRTVYTIRLSREEPTTCVFPGALTAVEGARVSARPEDAPAILLSYPGSGDFFSLRALQEEAHGALNVVFRGRVYVLSLTTGPDPDRAVTFLDEPLTGGGRRPAPVNVDELRALIDRARQHDRLAAQYPALGSTIERAAPGTTTSYPEFTATIEEVYRFDPEDTLVFRLRLENPGEVPVHYAAPDLAVRVAGEVYPAALVEGTGAIPPRAVTRVFLAVTGGPLGGRANLSIRETFTVIVPRA